MSYKKNGMITNILSIGQNKAMNYILKTVLANLYQLIIVEDVFLGMHLLKQKQDIDLIIIDVDYQTKEIVDMILHIDSSKIYKKPIIVLSGTENQQLNNSLIDSRVHASFTKPFNPLEMLGCINKLNQTAYLS